VNFSEQPPSKEWAALKYRGERIAEVWFKPDGEPCALTFRIPRESFRLPDLGQRLTTESLLKAVGIAHVEVASWHHEGDSHGAMDGSNPELGHPLPVPPPEAAHLTVHVRLKPADSVAASDESAGPEIPQAVWQDVAARWNAILGLEAAVDSLRVSMESLRAEMESSSKATLPTEVKQHAVSADMAQWNQLKSRLIFALPKVREFIHRSIWALGTPERKKLEELFKDDDRPDVTLAEMQQVQKQLDYLLKDRQLLSGQGATVYQECKRINADVQGALRTLRSNAAAKALKKRGTTRPKGTSF
jgi:hypothetical protein